MLKLTLVYVLMAAPTPSGEHIMNYAIPLSIHDTALDCAENKSWLDDHQRNLSRHLFCVPIELNLGEAV